MINASAAALQKDPWRTSLRPLTFDDYFGQKEIIDSLRLSIRASQRGGWVLEHFLFSGPPGVGKTSLAQVIARELNRRLLVTSGPSLSHRGEVAALLTSLRSGDVLFIDEIHRLPVVLQEMLYAAMEDFQITLTEGKGSAGGRSITVPLPCFTLLGATTHAGLLTAPLVDRFGFHWQLRHHDLSDIVAIVTRSARLLDILVDDAGCREIARRSRGTPRIANRLLRRVRDFATDGLHSAGCTINGTTVAAALTRLGVDHVGLDSVDRAYMAAVAGRGGRAIGIDAIAATIQAPRATLEDVVEPFLLQLGFVARTGHGRVLTEAGCQHLGLQVVSPARRLPV